MTIETEIPTSPSKKMPFWASKDSKPERSDAKSPVSSVPPAHNVNVDITIDDDDDISIIETPVKLPNRPEGLPLGEYYYFGSKSGKYIYCNKKIILITKNNSLL